MPLGSYLSNLKLEREAPDPPVVESKLSPEIEAIISTDPFYQLQAKLKASEKRLEEVGREMQNLSDLGPAPY